MLGSAAAPVLHACDNIVSTCFGPARALQRNHDKLVTPARAARCVECFGSPGSGMKGREMQDGYAGGCACGKVRFATPHAPIAMNDCQCRQCQQRSGTGHGSYLTFSSRADVRLQGTVKEWEVIGDAGTVKRHAFCPECGTPVYLTLPQVPDLFVVHAAALDEPGRYQPQFVVYTSSGQAWDRVDPELQRFERMPPAGGG
jgi:hypothetical protein